MKVLILSSSSVHGKDPAAERLELMADIIGQFDTLGIYRSIQKASQIQPLLTTERPDAVFCASYFISNDMSGEPLNIHRMLDQLGTPYIGADADALELVLSKAALKKRWEQNGINTPKSKLITNAGDLKQGADLKNFPYLVKPNLEGNSRGLSEKSIVFNPSDLELRVNELIKTFPEVLVEEYLGKYADIREFTIAMIGNGVHKLVMPTEVKLLRKKKYRIITTEDKDQHLTYTSGLPGSFFKEQLIAFAHEAFNVAGMRDYSRCDVIHANNTLFAIEINGQPMVPDLWFENCSKDGGLDKTQYINAILIAGILRNNKQKKRKITIPQKMIDSLPDGVYQKLLWKKEL